MPLDDRLEAVLALVGALERGCVGATLPVDGTPGASVDWGRGFKASGVPPSMGFFKSSPDIAHSQHRIQIYKQ